MMKQHKKSLSLIVFAFIIAISSAAPAKAAGTTTGGIDYSCRISAGENYSLAILDDNTLWGWGYDEGIHLGLHYSGTEGFVASPAKIMDNAKAVVAGWGQALVIKTDGSLWGWGDTLPSEGEDRLTFALKPEKIMDNVISAACGDWFTLAIKKDGSLWGWGKQLGMKIKVPNDPDNVKSVSRPVKLMSGVKKVIAADDTSYILKANGTLISWNSGLSSNEFVRNSDGGRVYIFARNVKTMSATENSLYFVKTDGSLWAIDDVSSGPVKLGNGYDTVAAGSVLPPMGLKKDGKLIALKSNYGISLMPGLKQSGNNTAVVMTGVKAISEGPMGFLAMKTDGSIYAWGGNEYGGIGDGTRDDHSMSAPVKLAFSAEVQPLFQDGSVQKSKLLSDWIKEGEASGKLPAFNASAKASFVGNWHDDVVVSGLCIRQSGSTVTGSDRQSGLRLKGTVKGNKITGYYVGNDVNLSRGVFEIYLSDDGKSFAGYLFLDSAAEAAFWTGTRID